MQAQYRHVDALVLVIASSCLDDTDAAKSVGSAQGSVAQRYGQIQADPKAARQDLSRPGDTADELRRSATGIGCGGCSTASPTTARDRHRPASAFAADDSELGVLADELPSYLESRGIPSDWVEPALA